MTASEPSVSEVVRLRPDRTMTLEALLVGAGPHLDALLDVGTAANGDLLLHVPVPAARLTALLQVPGFPTAAEAVTVLVPLAQALGRMHACGVATGSVAADQVVFDREGTPSWTAPVAPSLLRLVGEEAFTRAVQSDLASFRTLCDGLLSRAGAVLAAGPGLEPTVDALFRIADPAPIRLHPAAPAPEPWGPPSRLLPAASPEDPTALQGRRHRVGAVAARIAVPLRTVRARVWIAAAVAGGMLVAGVVLLPSGRADPIEPAASSTFRPTAGRPVVAAVPTVVPTLAAEPAVRALVEDRARCIAAGDERCLRGIDATDSPALAADLEVTRAGTEGVRIDPAAVRLRSAAAGTVLAQAGDVTILAVRQPDGWRIRDVVAAPPAG